MTTKSKLLKDNWNEWTDYQTESRTVGSKRQMEQAQDLMDKIEFVQNEVRTKLIENIPPEQEVAMRMHLYGVTEAEFWKMREHIKVSDPVFIKIGNHLGDLIRSKKK